GARSPWTDHPDPYRFSGALPIGTVSGPDGGPRHACWRTPVKQLGDILLEEGLVTEGQLMAALDEQAARGGESLGRVLVEIGMLTEGHLVATLARQVGMEFVELAEYPVDRNAVARVPASLCRRYTALPI